MNIIKNLVFVVFLLSLLNCSDSKIYMLQTNPLKNVDEFNIKFNYLYNYIY